MARRSRRVGGRSPAAGLMIDLDVSIVICHSDKEQAAPRLHLRYHPMLAFCDNTGEFLAAELRRGNAGSNTAADHITVLDAALAQIPDARLGGARCSGDVDPTRTLTVCRTGLSSLV